MPRIPDEYAVHLLLSGGHREEVRFETMEEFQKWYETEIVAKPTNKEFVEVPLGDIDGGYLVLRPLAVMGIRVEPVFAGSVDRDNTL